MAQFIKLTGGLLIIIGKIETCVSTILRLRSYVIQSKWACFSTLYSIEQIFLSIFSAPLVIIPQGEQKSLSSSYRKSENGVDTDLPCSPNALKLKEDTRVLLIISTKNRLAGALLLCFKIHKSEKNHLLKASFLGQKLKLNILWLLVKHEVFWLELEDHWYGLLFQNEVFYCLF